MDNKVLCPICGCELALLEFGRLGCCYAGDHATDCFVGYPKLFPTPEAALAAAQKRWVEKNRVLTLDEMRADFEGSVYVEFLSYYNTNINYRTARGYLEYSLESEQWEETPLDDFGWGRYGKTWRCWLRKPTDEERSAVPWAE